MPTFNRIVYNTEIDEKSVFINRNNIEYQENRRFVRLYILLIRLKVIRKIYYENRQRICY